MCAFVQTSCPEFPVERYAVELLASIGSPVLSSRLELLADNLNRLLEYYESKSHTSRPDDDHLYFLLDVLSSTVTFTLSVLRYKYVNRNSAIHNIVNILRFIGETFSYPEILTDVPRGTKSNVSRGTKKVIKKVGASK